VNGGTLFIVGGFKSISITDSAFEYSKSVGNGGTIFLNISNTPTIIIANCNFTNSSSEYGGAIYTNVLFTLSYSQFISCDASEGDDIYHAREGAQFLAENVIESCTYNDETNTFISNISTDDYSTYLSSCIVDSYYVRSGAAPNSYCLKETPCDKLSTVFTVSNNILDNSTGALLINILGASFVNVLTTVGNRRILLQPADSSAEISAPGNSGAFTVANGSLRLKSLVIVYSRITSSSASAFASVEGVGDIRIIDSKIIQRGSSSSTGAITPFIFIKDVDNVDTESNTEMGHVILQNVSITNIYVVNVPIIEIEKGGELVIDNLVCENVSGLLTEFPIFISAVGNGDVRVTVKNSVIKSISESGFTTVYGGVIGVKGFSSVSSFVSFDNISVANITLENVIGGFIYVENANLKIVSGEFINLINGSFTSGCISGGSIHAQGGKVDISNSNFEHSYSVDGGAIYFSTYSKFYLTDVRFSNCHAFQHGGGICTASNEGSDSRKLINVSFVAGTARGAGMDICDTSNAGEVYNTNNVINCSSYYLAYTWVSDIYPPCKFYMVLSHNILDCLLPYPGNTDTSCGSGEISVDSVNGHDHKLCGHSVQPCETLKCGVGVAVSGGQVVLKNGFDYKINNTNITNQYLSIKEDAVNPFQTSISSQFESVQNPLIIISNSSLTIEGINIVYEYHQYNRYVQKFFAVKEGSTLTLKGCQLDTSLSNRTINQTFIENSGGSVILDNVKLNFAYIEINPLFVYIIENDKPSSFTIINTVISGVTTDNPLLLIDYNKTNTLLMSQGSLYVINNTFTNINPPTGKGVNGMVVSAKLCDPSAPTSPTAYLAVIAFENNLFSHIGTADVINGGAVHLDTYVGDSSSQNYYFYNSTFVNCTAQEKGGAIYIYRALATFSFCSFIDCEVKNNNVYGRCIHVEEGTPYMIGIHLIQLCASHSVTPPSPVINIYAPPLTPDEQQACFPASCLTPVEQLSVKIISGVGSCAATINIECQNLGDLFTYHSTLNRAQIEIVSSGIYNPQVVIGNKTIRIFSSSTYPQRELMMSISSSDAFFTIDAGTLLVEDLNLLHNGGFIFFFIENGGCVRVTNCDVSNSIHATQGSFIKTDAGAKNSEIYIRNTNFQDLIYSIVSPPLASSFITIGNCQLLSLINVNISDGKGTYGVSSAFLVDAAPDVDDPPFRFELKNVQISGIEISHTSDSSKGLIAITTTDSKVNVTVVNSSFKDISLNLNTSAGGVFYLSGCESVIFENTIFDSVGGSTKAGAVYIEKCEDSKFKNVDFKNISIVDSSYGGAIYVELSDLALNISRTIKFDGGSFKDCRAPRGRGGAVYLEFVLPTADCPPAVSFEEYRNQSFYFNATIFEDNIATAGTNVFLDAYRIDELFSGDNFQVELTLDGPGLNEYMVVDNCEENKAVESIVVKLELEDVEGVIYVFGGDLICPFEDNPRIGQTCSDLLSALANPSGIVSNINIEIISSADLNDAVTIYGNKIIIEPLKPGQYVILVIGLSGTIYVESGVLPISYGRMSNEEQGGDVSFTRMDIRLAYKLGAPANALTVVRNGIVTFNDCLFKPESGGSSHAERASVYIADVTNSGKLVLNGCSVSNILVDAGVLIHALQESQLEIKVCICYEILWKFFNVWFYFSSL
jgi:hypothetical protein